MSWPWDWFKPKKKKTKKENKKIEKANENKDNKNGKENNKFKDNKESKEIKVEKNNRKLAENHNEKDEENNAIKEIKESKETEVEKNNRKLAEAHDEANKQKIEKYRNVLDVILDSMESAIEDKDESKLAKVCENLLKLLNRVNKLYVNEDQFTTPTTALLDSLSGFFQDSDITLDPMNLARFVKCLGNIECDPRDYTKTGLAKNCGLFLPEQQKKMLKLCKKAEKDIYKGDFASVYNDKNVKGTRESSSLLIGVKELHAYCSGKPIKEDSTPEYILKNVIGKEIEPNLLKIKEQLENEIKNLSNSKGNK